MSDDKRDSGEWVLQVSVKIGDHMVNVRGFSSGFVLDKLEEISADADRIHAALSLLDGGRPATEIVQKGKQWGARSQGGRSYAKPSEGGDWGGDKGEASGGWQKPAPPVVPDDVPEVYRACPQHGPTKYFPAGANKATGKPYGASMRCGTQGCGNTKWQDKSGSWD